MNVWTYACLVVGLLLVVAPVGALVPDTIAISTDPEWVTAGSGESATVTVQVSNSTSGNTSFEGVAIDFEVDGEYGSISPARVGIDSAGRAAAVFKPGTQSGTATITATVSCEGLDEPLTGSVDLYIDHAAPHAIAGLWYESEVTAGGMTDITVRMVDRYGNVVDDRREAETVKFTVGSPAGGAVFVGGTDEITVSVDDAGNATVTLEVDTVAGENIVLVTFPGKIGSRYLTVNGLANGEPSEIYQSVSPKVEDLDPESYPELPLDGQFTITYALYDEYGNPAGGRQIRVNVQSVSGSLTSGEWLLKTNSQGKAQITYGPSVRAGVAEIVATAVDNNNVSCSQKVGFYSTTPTNMLLTAVPQTIASGDVKDDLISYIKAKVMDSKGNPVRNESVSFRIVSIDNGTTPMTDGPKISNETHTYGDIGTSLVAMTDEDGFATIDFHPGKFTRDTSDLGYSNMASGNATIQAVWNGEEEETVVSFRNYPYLSVRTSVEPQSVAVNGSVNVTVQLIGDGWALQSRPIDVVLCTDRSGSMLKNTTTVPGYNSRDREWIKQESIDDRMVHAMRAAKSFTSQMQPLKDRVGLVSFGQSGKADLDTYGNKFWAGNDYEWKSYWWWHEGYWGWERDSSDDNVYIPTHYDNPQTYSGPATRDLELTLNYKDVNTTIDKWLPCGGTPMREGLYRSVRMIMENPRTDNPVKAIVLLTDGEWNTGGNPEGGDGATPFLGVGTGSVIDYAKGEGIKIFTIALGDEPSHDELLSYANQTGGRFYSATAGDDLTQVYEDIAQKLQEAAGVNTTMDLAFDPVTININNTPTLTNDALEYDSDYPTKMLKYWTNNGSVFWGPKWVNQAENGDWDGQNLTFDVGDIYLNQTWETTFRLKVLKEGNIDIFGNESVIHFNGTQGETELGLPHTFITASLVLNETDATTADIWLYSLTVSTEDPGILVPSWNLNYTGNKSVTQKVLYQFSPDNIWWDGTWHAADTKHHPSDTDINGTYSSRLDLKKEGGWYKIRVTAREDTPDGASAEITRTDPILVETRNVAYIKIG